MRFNLFAPSFILLLTVGCGQLEERHVVGKATSYSQENSGNIESGTIPDQDSNSNGSSSGTTPSKGQNSTQPAGTGGVPTPVASTPKLKHADDLEMINSWKVGSYEGNDLFKLTLTAALPFQ